MRGVVLRFFVHEGERHAHQLLFEWLLAEAQRTGLPGGRRSVRSQATAGTAYCTNRRFSSSRETSWFK